MSYSAKGASIGILSPSGDQLGIIDENTDDGGILNPEIELELNGGVKSFSFSFSSAINTPITKNAIVLFYYKSIFVGVGEINSSPLAGSDSNILTAEGVGLTNRLDKIMVNESYTSETLQDITEDLLSSYLGLDVGIFYDVLKIATLPVITGIDIDFLDITLFEALKTIIQISNYDYNSQKFRYYIDAELDLVIEEIDEDTQATFFEGYQYQSPEVEIDTSNIVNRILTYRSTEADTSIIEYVSTVEDTDSQNRNGIYEKKLTFPAFTTTDTIQKMANALIGRNGDELRKVSIESLVCDDVLDFSYYNIFNKRTSSWRTLSACDTLTGWDNTYLSTATLALSTDHILAGRQSLKLSYNESSSEHLEFTPTNKIRFPQKHRVFLYFSGSSTQMRIRFYGLNGEFDQITFGTLDENLETSSGDMEVTGNVLVNYPFGFTSSSVDYDAGVTASTIDYTLGASQQEIGADTPLEVSSFTSITPNTWAELKIDASISSVEEVWIFIDSDAVGEMYLSLIDNFSGGTNSENLLLESINYKSVNNSLVCSANFGEKPDSLIDEIKESVSDGDIALSIFSKQ